MYHKSAITIIFFIALLLPGLGCGPNCQKIMSTKKPEDIAKEDTARINGLVERRKAAMETAKDANQYVIEEAKQTVTACEMAIEFQYRIITLQEGGSPLVQDNIKKVNDARCFLDEVLLSKGKLIGAGKGALISGSNARQIRAYLEEFNSLFGTEGTVSERRLVNIYENGLKAAKAEKDGDIEEGDEGLEDEGESSMSEDEEGEGLDDALGDDSSGEADDGAEEEDGSEEESSDDSMGSF